MLLILYNVRVSFIEVLQQKKNCQRMRWRGPAFNYCKTFFTRKIDLPKIVCVFINACRIGVRKCYRCICSRLFFADIIGVTGKN